MAMSGLFTLLYLLQKNLSGPTTSSGLEEVLGLNLTHCADECGPGQATHAHLPVTKQYNLVRVKGR